MCVASMIFDHFHDKWAPRIIPVPTWPPTYIPIPVPSAPLVSPDEIAEFRKLLDRAREYDRKTNQPDCELDKKRKKLKRLAKDLGVEIDFV